MDNNHFMGKDGFYWFCGVVEDRNDPAHQGRVRVRIVGHHTPNLTAFPTSELPWAHVMHPVTDPSMHGMGNSASWLVEGSHVVGFFRDSHNKQQPLIIGSLPGQPSAPADHTTGFNDPRHKESTQIDGSFGIPFYAAGGENPEEYNEYGPYPLGAIKDTTDPVKEQTKYSRSSGHTYGETDTNRLARGITSETHGALADRRKRRRSSIPTATRPHIPSVEDASVLGTGVADPVVTWDEPHPKGLTKDADPYVSGKYPYNHVYESECGHILEIDDSKGGERLHREHCSGTFEEWHPTGDKVVKVVGSNYELIAGSSNVIISGDVNLTIEGNKKELIKGNYVLEVEGDFTRKIHKNERVKIGAGSSGGNLESEIRGNYSYNVNDNVNGRVGKDQDVAIFGNELRVIEGYFRHTVTDNISQKSTTGSITREAKVNISETATTGIYTAKAGTSMNLQAVSSVTMASNTASVGISASTSMSQTSGTTFTETVGTNAIKTVAGTLTNTITGVGEITMNGTDSKFIAKNSGGTLIGLTTHTHTDPAHAQHTAETSVAND